MVTKPRKDIVRKYFNKYFVPFVFRKATKPLTILIAILLIVTGVFSTFKLLRGLNQNVSLVSGSDIYDYFESMEGGKSRPTILAINLLNPLNPK